MKKKPIDPNPNTNLGFVKHDVFHCLYARLTLLQPGSGYQKHLDPKLCVLRLILYVVQPYPQIAIGILLHFHIAS